MMYIDEVRNTEDQWQCQVTCVLTSVACAVLGAAKYTMFFLFNEFHVLIRANDF